MQIEVLEEEPEFVPRDDYTPKQMVGPSNQPPCLRLLVYRVLQSIAGHKPVAGFIKRVFGVYGPTHAYKLAKKDSDTLRIKLTLRTLNKKPGFCPTLLLHLHRFSDSRVPMSVFIEVGYLDKYIIGQAEAKRSYIHAELPSSCGMFGFTGVPENRRSVEGSSLSKTDSTFHTLHDN